MVNDDPAAAVRRAVDAISDRSIGDRVAELLAPSFVRHDLAGLVSGSHGPEGASGLVTMITAAMPDFRPGIEDISGAGDRATVRLPMSGTAQPRRCPASPQPAAARQPARCSSTALPGAAWPRAWQIVDGLAFTASQA